MGVETGGDVRMAKTTEAGILEATQERRADLLVLGTGVRPGSDRLYLGPQVERIILQSECPVVVFNT
jgi:nucleotide-binding universal stress UspA family protein